MQRAGSVADSLSTVTALASETGACNLFLSPAWCIPYVMAWYSYFLSIIAINFQVTMRLLKGRSNQSLQGTIGCQPATGFQGTGR